MDATLLIADGESPSRDVLERFFVQCGFRVDTACDALECVNKLRWLEPDVLVLDLDMPWGGAAGVVTLLHENRWGAEIPAVLIIGSASPAVLSQATGVPPSFCLQKPVRPERLLDWVGLAVAWIDLHRNGRARANRRSSPLPIEEEVCLT
jgi:CheY-like chemotaxis protein